MRIRNKLTISFSLLVIGVLLVFSVTVYFFSSLYRKSEFFNRLKRRVEITEKIFLEKSNSAEFRDIQQQFLIKLPQETEEVVEFNPAFRKSLKVAYPDSFLAEILTTGEAFFELDDRQGSGKLFHVKGKDYLVLLTAVDQVGIRVMSHLVTIIVVVMVLCMMAMILLSHFLSGSLLNPITAQIRKANSISARNLHERLRVSDPNNELGELAAAFNDLLDRVEQAFHTQKLFIDNASHEMRNPLTAILGETELALQKSRTQEEYIESLNTISREAERLNVIINDLLQLAGISQRDVALSRERIHMTELMMEMKQKIDARYPGNAVKINIGDDVDACVIDGNRHLLTMALFNIVDNACKFSRCGPVDVSVTLLDGDRVEMITRDKGIGIPANDIGKILVPFHRATNARQVKGTGLGIPMTARILHLHGGKFEVKSELNAGTEVRIVLPVVTEAL